MKSSARQWLGGRSGTRGGRAPLRTRMRKIGDCDGGMRGEQTLSAQRCSSRACLRLIGQRPAVSVLGGRRTSLPGWTSQHLPVSLCLSRGPRAEMVWPLPAGIMATGRRRTAAGRPTGRGGEDLWEEERVQQLAPPSMPGHLGGASTQHSLTMLLED